MGQIREICTKTQKKIGGFLIGLLAGEKEGASSIGRSLAEKYTSGAVEEGFVATSNTTKAQEVAIKADISEAELVDNEYLELDNIF